MSMVSWSESTSSSRGRPWPSLPALARSAAKALEIVIQR